MNIVCNHDDCFGCSLCCDVCPVGAISMRNDSGWYRPNIDENKCVDCGKCIQACQSYYKENIENNLNKPKKCYAAWCIDDETHFNSSSGGIATKLAEWFIRKGGLVAGVVYNRESQEAVHILTDNKADLSKLSKSKYMQSNKTGIWNEIAQKLKERPVLFFGVGCEINALKTLVPLRRRENLFCVDLLCRGGASPLLFKNHLHMVSKAKCVDNVTFRGGRNDCSFTVYEQDRIVYKEGQYEDVYFAEFMRHSIFSPTCYECPFARNERGGDLTLGDFWGLNEEILVKTGGKGVNLCLVNTDKGQRLLNMISVDIHLYSRSLDEAIAGNETLYMPTAKPKDRERLWNLIPQIGFEEAAKNVYADYYYKVWLRRHGWWAKLMPRAIYEVIK